MNTYERLATAWNYRCVLLSLSNKIKKIRKSVSVFSCSTRLYGICSSILVFIKAKSFDSLPDYVVKSTFSSAVETNKSHDFELNVATIVRTFPKMGETAVHMFRFVLVWRPEKSLKRMWDITWTPVNPKTIFKIPFIPYSSWENIMV